MADRIVKKALAGREDLLIGRGTTLQQRGDQLLPIAAIDVPWLVADNAEVRALDTTKYSRVIVDEGSVTREYFYDAAATGSDDDYDILVPDSLTATGRWVLHHASNLIKAVFTLTDAAALSYTGTAFKVVKVINATATFVAGSGSEWQYTGAVIAGNAGNWPHADGYGYDQQGRQYVISGAPWFTKFGAIGDGVTDDYNAILAASAQGSLYSEEGFAFKITDAISIPVLNNCKMLSPIVYHGAKTKTVLDLNNSGAIGANLKARIMVQSNAVDWTSSSYIGVKFTNVRYSKIDLQESIGFYDGVRLTGSGQGVVHNEIQIGNIANNQRGLVLRSETSGWVNENNFDGGYFTVGSAVNTTTSRYGVVIESPDSYLANNNHFYKPAFELNGTAMSGGAESLPIDIVYGTNNYFHGIRSEGSTYNTSGNVARCQNNSSRNVVSVGYVGGADINQYGSYYVQNTGTGFNLGQFESNPDIGWVEFIEGSMTDLATPYDATRTHIRGLSTIRFSSSDTPADFATSLPIDQANGVVEVPSSRGIGVRIKLNGARQITIAKACESGQLGRVVVQIRDSSQTIITNAGSDKVIADYSTPVAYVTDFGGGWRAGSDDAAQRTYEIISATAEYADVIFVGGTNPCKLQGFSVKVRRRLPTTGTATTFSGAPSLVNVLGTGSLHERRASQAPVSLAWNRGDVIYDDDPSASGKIGWVCVASGTPGTWKAFGAIDA